MSEKRPRVRIRFKYNQETGKIEDLIIDDNAPTAGDAYHDEIAALIAGYLGRNPDISDAGPIRLSRMSAETGDTAQTDQRTDDDEVQVTQTD